MAEVDSPVPPRFFAFPSIDYPANSASSVEAVGDRSVHSPTGARANYDLCSILSTLGLRHNKNLEHYYNNPIPGHNTVNDTSDLPMDATTSHPRRISLYLYWEQRKHRSYQVLLSLPAVSEMRWVAGDHTPMEQSNRAKRTVEKDNKMNRRIEKDKKVNRTGRSHHRGQGDKLHILSIRLM